MNRPDREDAVARALDILPPGDPAASDPRLVRDEALSEEARATREAAADVWLAVSPLRAAPPDVLASVLDKIGLPAPELPVPKVRRLAPLLAASGWAAAVAVAICLWPRDAGEKTSHMVVGTPKTPSAKSTDREEGTGGDASGAAGSADYDVRTERLRRDYANLQKTVEMLRRNELATLPRVMNLRTPGSPHRSPEESRQQMFQKMYQMMANSFRDQLEVYEGEPGDAADFVIERGYMQPGMDLASSDIVLRHLNFPQQSWQDYNLLRSDDGEYYDPIRQLLWTSDPVGGGFVGRRMENVDLAAFRGGDTGGSTVKTAVAKNDPEGFILEDPVTKKAEVVIDQVPPAQAGHEHRILWTDASGASGTIPVVSATSATATANTNASGAVYFVSGNNRYLTLPGGPFQWNGDASSGNLVAANSAGSPATVMASFSTTSTVTSFQLVEVPIQGGAGATTRVIVAGGN